MTKIEELSVSKTISDALSANELNAFVRALEKAKVSRLNSGARFDFFGGAVLDLDSVYVSLARGEELVSEVKAKRAASAK